MRASTLAPFGFSYGSCRHRCRESSSTLHYSVSNNHWFPLNYCSDVLVLAGIADWIQPTTPAFVAARRTCKRAQVRQIVLVGSLGGAEANQQVAWKRSTEAGCGIAYAFRRKKKRVERFKVLSSSESKWETDEDSDEEGTSSADEESEDVETMGVKAAVWMLNLYRREISPLMPRSCRFVPSCSEYSIVAYKRYGVVKGTILTAWRLCRCNPLGGSGFDPPRWFGEEAPPQ